MSYLAGGMYFLAMPSCLLSTKVSWVDKQQGLKQVCLHCAEKVDLPPGTPTSGAWSPSLLSVCLLGVTVTRGAWKEKQKEVKVLTIWQLLTHASRQQGIDQDLSDSDMSPVNDNLPMSSWMVTRSSTLNEVSSFRGWLHRWHTKLTCMVVLVEDLEPSITARKQTNNNTPTRYLVNRLGTASIHQKNNPLI